MADFQSRLDEFQANEIALYALSTDDAEHARQMADEHGLAFPVLHGIDGPAFAHSHGAFHEARRDILHATGYVLKPDGTVGLAVYSTGARGRLTPDDALGQVAFWRKQ